MAHSVHCFEACLVLETPAALKICARRAEEETSGAHQIKRRNDSEARALPSSYTALHVQRALENPSVQLYSDRCSAQISHNVVRTVKTDPRASLACLA